MVDCTCGNSEGGKRIHHQWASVWEVVSHYSMYPKIKKRTAQLNDSSSSFKSFVFPVIYYRYSPMLNPWGLAPNPNRSIALGMPGVRPGRAIRWMCAAIGQGAMASIMWKHDKTFAMTRCIFYFFWDALWFSRLDPHSYLDEFSTDPWWIGRRRTPGPFNLSPDWNLTLHCVHCLPYFFKQY